MAAPAHINLLTGGVSAVRPISAAVGAAAAGNASGADAAAGDVGGNGFSSLLIGQLLQLDAAENPALGSSPLTLLTGQAALAKLAPGQTDPNELLDAEMAAEDPAAFFAALGLATVTPQVNAAANQATAGTDDAPLLHDARAALAARLAAAGQDADAAAGGGKSGKAAIAADTAQKTQKGTSTEAVDDAMAAAKTGLRAVPESDGGGNFAGNLEKVAAKLAVAPDAASSLDTAKLGADAQAKPVTVPTHGIAATAADMAQSNVSSSGEASRVSTPLSDRAWAGEFGQKILWLAGNDRQSAQLSINPAHLGPVDISLNIDSDRRATMVFASPHAEVREAIENALPRLRELFANAGIELGQTNVSSESFRQQQQQNAQFQQSGGGSDPYYPSGAGDMRESVSVVAETSDVRRGNGLINTFA